MASPAEYVKYQYGTERELQNLGVWEVDILDKSKVWVIYIHGGAWRDPRITHLSFLPTVHAVSRFNSGKALSRIAGFASLDYRLSPHQNIPQDAETTSAKEKRDARHPDHIDDVRAGVSFLQKKYGFTSNYLVIGHSAGACLAFQLVSAPAKGDVSTFLPSAVIGIAGIYDYTGINERHGDAYSGFLTAAFGDAKDWDCAMPPAKTDLGSWKGRVVLAWSRDDELVDEPEIDRMELKLRNDGLGPLVIKDLSGSHNECWEKGTDIARLMTVALDEPTS